MKRTSISVSIIAAVFAASLSGCMVGPNYEPPRTEVEPGFGELGNTTGIDPAAQPSHAVEEMPITRWWRTFRDPELDRLINEAVQQNYQLQAATVRIRQARALRGIAASGLFPQVGGNLGYNRARGSENVDLPLGGGGSAAATADSANAATGQKARAMVSQGDPLVAGVSSGGAAESGGSGTRTVLSPFGGGGLPGVNTELYQAGFDANWELDFFGGTRRRIEAANAEIQGAIENRRDMLVTLLAEVARDYVELRGAQRRLAVARENLEAQREILDLTTSMAKAGLASELDQTRAAAQVATTTSTIPPLEAQVREMIHALSTLLGKQPNALSRELTEAKPVPPAPPRVPVGLPSELLRRRPDIRAAERQIAATTARIGGAKADLFPKFSITGSMGLDSSSLSHLLEWDSRYFLFSPTVSWPIFSAERIRSNIELQKANRQAALLQYRGAILIALQEVEDALARYATQQARRAALTEALDQSRQALDIARDQYKNGLIDFLTVLEAQRSVLAAQDALAGSDALVSTDLVALYKALGGGWQE